MKNPAIKYLFQNQILSAIFIVLVGWLLLQIKDILAALFISFIIMAALFPLVGLLRKKGLPNVVSVVIAYFTTLILLVLLIFPLVPFFTSQMQSLFSNFPSYLNDAARLLNISVDFSQVRSIITSEFEDIGRRAFALTGRIFGGVFSTLTILVISFYLLIEHDLIKKDLAGLFPKQSREKVLDTINKIEEKVGAWMRGQIILSFAVGLITWITLTALGLSFALPLALLAGLLEIVPTIGPIIASVPAIIVALSISPTMAIVVAIVYIVIQVIENNVLVPKIMQKAVGLNPIIVIIGVIIGAKFMGVLGALLSVPFISSVIVIFKSFKD